MCNPATQSPWASCYICFCSHHVTLWMWWRRTEERERLCPFPQKEVNVLVSGVLTSSFSEKEESLIPRLIPSVQQAWLLLTLAFPVLDHPILHKYSDFWVLNCQWMCLLCLPSPAGSIRRCGFPRTVSYNPNLEYTATCYVRDCLPTSPTWQHSGRSPSRGHLICLEWVNLFHKQKQPRSWSQRGK